jgi:hypothetical protein
MQKTIEYFYSIFMPAITIILLFGVSPFVTKQTPIYCGIVKILLCAWFCTCYIMVSRLSNYGIYPNIRWKKSDVGPMEKYFLISAGVFIGIISAIVTGWTIQIFVPIFGNFFIVVAVLNGLIIMIPIVRQYWVLKM